MTSKPSTKSQFIEIEQSNLVEHVKEKLIMAIARGELGPGERIVEAELARRMGISRGPVREAARLLQQRGILTSEARRGFFVKRVSLEEIDNLVDYWICIESYAAKKAVLRATKSQVNQLRNLYDLAAEAEGRSEQDPLAGLEAAIEFHSYIFMLSGNPRLAEAFESFVVQIRQIATVVNVGDDDNRDFFGKHLLKVVEMFEVGNPETVGKAIKNYLELGRDQTKKFYIDRNHGQ